MDFLKFVVIAVLSSAIVSAVLFAIISNVTSRTHKTRGLSDKPAEAGTEVTRG
jgi:hypothetical protein